MVTRRGSSDVKRFMAALPEELRSKVLKGAARAAGNVVAEEARERSISQDVRAGVVVDKAEEKGSRIVVQVTVKGSWARSVGFWLEYGTSPHFISVDPALSGGRTAARVNAVVAGGLSDLKQTLVINGKPVGATVYHPGAQPHPFLRPALDLKQADAIAAAQRFIDARVSRKGIVGTADPEGGA